MSMPARVLRLRGEVEYRDQGEPLLKMPGDAVLVRRGVARSLLVACPDGCGERLVVNLDPRTAKAWRMDMRGGEVTLYPSVWRDGGCGSHFIVWRGRIIWCDRFEQGNVEPPYDAALEHRLYTALELGRLRSSEDLAIQLDEIPWEVSRAARRLVQKGFADAGTGIQRDWFRRKGR
ncbi:DUF6527 family protein [Mesorhizobium sp. WSM3876]|uniref:DUF6527 family protein n=1 Tax=Mesorhizobium sp. WSM3876 TaxID=422277 RepID=UPI000BCA059A|nr:DUF6527 family protein [Mesorhizobium sp. WSM3876]PBB84544.1 hypothetical protein CK216_23230 [Mesorhizobium sp. WSM3876]